MAGFASLALSADYTAAVRQSGLSGGLVVALDFSDGPFLSELAMDKRFVVQGLLQSEAELEKARGQIKQKGAYGPVSCDRYNGKDLPYIDNLINVLLCKHTVGVSKEELLRVLAPGGMLMVERAGKWISVVKPWPASGMDEWNQFLHGADNNGVSMDDVGPLQRVRWIGDLTFGRSKSISPSVTSMVSANGRIFTIEDRATTEDINAPVEYCLVARDAFNGMNLWMKPMKKWDQWQTFSIKFVPTQQQRSLAAVGELVYCCPEFGGPLTVYDAKNGDEVRVYKNTAPTTEFAIDGDLLYGIKGAPVGMKKKGASNKSSVELYALDLKKNTIIWTQPIDDYAPGTLAVKGARLAYYSQKKLTCLASLSGKVQWTKAVAAELAASDQEEDEGGDPRVSTKKKKNDKKKKSKKKADPLSFSANIHPTVVITDEMVLTAIDASIDVKWLKDGSTAWTAQGKGNYMKSPDLFVVNGLVWGRDLKGRELKTGKVVQTLQQEETGPMSHDRCYRNHITHRYYLNSASGGTDFLKLDGTAETPNAWARSTCGLSVMPAYGMVYNGPYVCQCTIGEMITGLNGLYNGTGNTDERFQVQLEPRLVKGPAFGEKAGAAAGSADWPTYRYSNERGAVTDIETPKQLAQKWKVNIGSHPTAPVVAGDQVLVADRDGYTVYALDRNNGQTRWTYTAGGRIDSPPTYYKGLVLFGSRAGWVYCLRASDGALVWKFNGLPERRLMADTGRFESAWPVNGSIMVQKGIAYFAAGRSTFLDGGIALFGLDPFTGAMKHGKIQQGPYQDNKRNFPIISETGTFRIEGFKSGIFSSADDQLFIRHQGFEPDLTPIKMSAIKTLHLMASPGFLSDSPQHRTYWTIDQDLRYGGPSGSFDNGPAGDSIAFDGKKFYEIRGYAPGRNLNNRGRDFVPASTYSVFSGELKDKNFVGKPQNIPTIGKWGKRWGVHTPFAGHAIAVAKNTLLAAGVPVLESYSLADTKASYAGQKGGLAWLLDTATGAKLQELKLDAAPTWDGIAVAHHSYFLTLKDGSVICYTGK